MRTSAERIVIKCERAIKEHRLEDARKLAYGISILTGQEAWKKAYDFIIDERDPEEEIRYRTVDIPVWMVDYLDELHRLSGVEFKNQSVRGGTQVALMEHQAVF